MAARPLGYGIACLALALAVAVISACGGDDTDDGREAGQPAAEESVQSDFGACPLSAEVVDGLVDEPITETSLSIGGVGGGSGSASIDSEGVEVETGDAFSLSWTGCNYEAEDGTRYGLAELVDDDGNPDPDAPSRVPDGISPAMSAGDEAAWYEDHLVFREGDRAYVAIGRDAEGEPLGYSKVERLAAGAAEALE